MSLESILEHILQQANTEKNSIIQEARLDAERITSAAQQEADILFREIIAREKAAYENQRQWLIVNARLEQKKNLLSTKQGWVDSVFKKLKPTLKGDQLKKQQVSPDKVKEVPEDIDFYLSKLRQDYETEIARIIFEQ